MTTFEKVKDIIVDQLGVDPDDVRPESTFVDDLGADSLDLVELVMAAEDEFNIAMPDVYMGQVKTVQDVVDFIKQETGAAA